MCFLLLHSNKLENNELLFLGHHYKKGQVVFPCVLCSYIIIKLDMVMKYSNIT